MQDTAHSSKPVSSPLERLLLATAILLGVVACQREDDATFQARVARAEALEKTPSGLAFISTAVRSHSGDIDAMVHDCYAATDLAGDRFTLVADITTAGRPTNVQVRPETTQTMCVAKAFGDLAISTPRPPEHQEGLYPVFIRLNYNK